MKNIFLFISFLFAQEILGQSIRLPGEMVRDTETIKKHKIKMIERFNCLADLKTSGQTIDSTNRYVEEYNTDGLITASYTNTKLAVPGYTKLYTYNEGFCHVETHNINIHPHSYLAKSKTMGNSTTEWYESDMNKMDTSIYFNSITYDPNYNMIESVTEYNGNFLKYEMTYDDYGNIIERNVTRDSVKFGCLYENEIEAGLILTKREYYIGNEPTYYNDKTVFKYDSLERLIEREYSVITAYAQQMEVPKDDLFLGALDRQLYPGELTDNDYLLLQLTYYEYDSAGFLSVETFYKYDPFSNKTYPPTGEITEYDSHGNVICFREREYKSLKKYKETYTKYLLTYDDRGLLSKQVVVDREGTVYQTWVYKYSYFY